MIIFITIYIRLSANWAIKISFDPIFGKNSAFLRIAMIFFSKVYIEIESHTALGYTANKRLRQNHILIIQYIC